LKTLVCPLNWGLGHASRCVPIIRNLIADGHQVVVVAEGYPLALLQNEFPTLRFLQCPTESIRYSSSNTQVGAMLFVLLKLLSNIYKEHRWLRKLIQKEAFTQIISDNRFGMWNKSIHSIYITHQLMIKMPKMLKVLEPLAHQLHLYFIKKYDECWIPDLLEGNGLTHDLSHKYPLPKNAKFIGILSRFQQLSSTQPTVEYETVVLISGIEPQRSIFEREMVDQFKHTEQKTLILLGKPATNISTTINGNITIVNHMDDEPLVAALLGCKKIIARSGYSTIMDLHTLNCLNKARWIPTPGQTEQEYLAIVN
jgi:hypothetical protein